MTTILIARGGYAYTATNSGSSPDVAFGIFCVAAFLLAYFFKKHNT